MARPKKDKHEQRSERFNLRYTAAELSFLRAEASKAALSPHEYARRRSLGERVPSGGNRADPALISELNRIGVNLNQLTRMSHLGKDITDQWGELAFELRQALALVMAQDGA